MELKDKKVIVTGGARGIGRSLVEQLINEDAIVGIFDIDHEQFKEIKETHPNVLCIECDTTNPDQVETSVETFCEQFGKIDILINSAASTERGTILSTSPELFNKIINTNVRAPFFLIQKCAKIMRREKSGGAIVSISSIVSHGGPPYLAAYNLSKSALNNLTKTTAYALMRDNIRVNAICPGWMDTEGETVIQKKFHDADDDWLKKAEKNQPFGRLLKPDEIAKTVIFLCSKDSGIMTGSIVDFDQSISGVPGINYDVPYLKDTILGN